MHFQRTPLASALVTALVAMSTAAYGQEQALPQVIVTASPFATGEELQTFMPAKVLTRDELRDKRGVSLGDTLSRELGVSQSAFGAGASRPVIRGLEGPRIKVLQNGMNVADVSTASNDHAVGSDNETARQIEILRGPAALLYGSGAIGGLINVVNDRIPDLLLPKPTGTAELRLSSVDSGKTVSLAADGAAGKIGLHADASWHDTSDYKIPGLANPNDPSASNGRLTNSFTRRGEAGFGASYIESWGHIGASVGTLKDHYGIPTAERSFIDLSRTRYDINALVNSPITGISSFKFKLGATDYQHTEKQPDGTPNTVFANKATETRWELTHLPIAGWRGTFGIQTENNRQSALSAATGTPDTVPITRSTSLAAFIFEEKEFGSLRASGGVRLESVKRSPDASSGFADRNFNLASWSVGGLWTFKPGYALGAIFSYAERAPTAEELYSNGPHESSATFDIGTPGTAKEKSRNIDISLQKTEDKIRWKANVFHNRFSNFIYGRVTGMKVDGTGAADPGGEFTQRFWSQGSATVYGAEAEISYNLRGEGWSLRGFADTSRGKLDGQNYLPLQPATRFGMEVGYREGAWRGGASLLHALRQDRLATFETSATPAYTQLDANLSWTHRVGGRELTWFALAKNLLNQDIRVSTSLLKDVAPLPGRNLIIGARLKF
ncbi:MAG: TonB-dependent receptor [Burkholderiales bacterium]|nr:TonB-dependent receptor [Burkholderiales bacterium]